MKCAKVHPEPPKNKCAPAIGIGSYRRHTKRSTKSRVEWFTIRIHNIAAKYLVELFVDVRLL